MLLRWLVTNYFRQAAEQKVYETVANAQWGREPQAVDPHPSAASQGPPQRCDIAVLFALPIEAGGTVDLLSDCQTTRWSSYLEHTGYLDQRRIVVGVSGVGREAAMRAADDILAAHRPQWVVSAGFAGALQSQLGRGHFLMPDLVLDEVGQELSIGFKIDPRVVAATRGLHVGRLLTVDRLVQAPAERMRLAEEHRALAFDTETGAVAEACRRQKTRFLAIRIISDEVDDELPAELTNLLNQKSVAGKLGAATGAIFKRPASIKQMWQMKDDAGRASDRLAAFVAGILRQLDVRPESAEDPG